MCQNLGFDYDSGLLGTSDYADWYDQSTDELPPMVAKKGNGEIMFGPGNTIPNFEKFYFIL